MYVPLEFQKSVETHNAFEKKNAFETTSLVFMYISFLSSLAVTFMLKHEYKRIIGKLL